MKKRRLLYLFFLLLLAFPSTSQTKALENRVRNFNEFRTALTQDDKAGAKSFFEFPIQSPANEIWYLAYADDENATAKVGDGILPFTESDFDLYFEKIFPGQFIECLLEIEPRELYVNGAYQTSDTKTGSATYSLSATFRETDRILELHFAWGTAYKLEGKNEYDIGETSYIYYFKVLPDGKMLFQKFLMAG
jgi:hypothetical protein